MGGHVRYGAESAASMAARWRAHHVQPCEQEPVANLARGIARADCDGKAVFALVRLGNFAVHPHNAIPASAGIRQLAAARQLATSMGGGCACDICPVFYAV